MRKFFTFFFLVAICFTTWSQTHVAKTLSYGGTVRQYLEYVPDSYDNTHPLPVLFCLHGLGDTMTNFAQSCGFTEIAEEHGWIMITPQALPANLSVLGMNIPMGAAWGAGVKATTLISTIELNPNVDDVGFLMAILDNLVATYNIDQHNVFATGFSIGGFMANRLAIAAGNRLRAIASVSGTIGNAVNTNMPVAHISAMHIHGTADSTIAYTDGSYTMSLIPIPIGSVGLGAEATVDYWKNYNSCDATPIVTNFSNSANDGLTFSKYLYENGYFDTKTAFIKVVGGAHEWYSTPANDIDYATEIYNFFASCLYDDTKIEENESADWTIYPNPATDVIRIEGDKMAQVQLLNSIGQIMTTIPCTDTHFTIHLDDYATGLYLIRTTSVNGQSGCKRLIINK